MRHAAVANPNFPRFAVNHIGGCQMFGRIQNRLSAMTACSLAFAVLLVPLPVSSQPATAVAADPALPFEPPVGCAAPGQKPDAKIHLVSKYPGAQAAVDAAKPGDAVVFDVAPKTGKHAVVVRKPLEDVQFIGGAADWDVQADLTDCQFFWHSAAVKQKSGKITRSAFYSSFGPSQFTHLDAVSFYYGGGDLLWPAHNPDNGSTPQLQMYGFVRAVTVHKPVAGYVGIEKRFDMNWEPSLRVNATDPVGNGYGTYILSPIVWGQRAWTPHHIVRATGLTWAHVNTEYNIWADPCLQVDDGTDCVVLCPGFGAHGEANNNQYTAAPKLLKYHDHEEWGHDNGGGPPFRGPAVQIAGQRNRLVAMGSYKNWSIGRKQWLPGLHYGTGVVAKDPFLQQFSSSAAGLTANFAQPKNVFVTKRDKGGASYISTAEGKAPQFPIAGSNLIRPTLIPLKDLRAIPAQLGKDKIIDMTGKSAEEIYAKLHGGKGGQSVYIGPGTYKFTKTIRNGRVFGAGVDKTILEWPADVDCAQRDSHGFVNCTVKGGKFGFNSQVGEGGLTFNHTGLFLRTRFVGQSEAAINVHATQNHCIQDCEFIDCKVGVTQGAVPKGPGVYTGENGEKGGLNIDKLDITNCRFQGVKDAAILLRPWPQPNGQVAVHNCSFEDVGGQAISIKGGQTHLVQQCRFVRCGSAQPDKPVVEVHTHAAVALSHLTIDNGSKSTAIGIDLRGWGAVSHCSVKGCKTALKCPSMVVDHVDSDGTLETWGGSFVARCRLANLNQPNGASVAKEAGAFEDVTAKAGVQPLDTTPPPAVGGVKVTATPEGNRIEWPPVDDPESGVTQYVVYSRGKEVGRTLLAYEPPTNFHEPTVRPVVATSFLDPTKGNGEYTVKALNGANLLSGGGTATVMRWGAVRGRFLDKDGKEIVIKRIEVQGKDTFVTDAAGKRSPASEVGKEGNPQIIYIEPGRSLTHKFSLPFKE
ncbi:MAG: hypothetical protein C0467_31440 [Planctomycetaceae bacterium]|nr:hypothetical protein [Planctomycetaceae bacterium]